MGSSKIKENHNPEKPNKMKKTATRHRAGHQGSPSKKKNIKMPEPNEPDRA